MTSIVACFLYLALILNLANGSVQDMHSECRDWAEEGECLKNHRFMWSSCTLSCAALARDDDERCANWAAEG